MATQKHVSQILTFTSVVDHGSFTKAAAAIGLTKSAVSQQISTLEAQLGLRLLNRTTRGISVTALGARLYERSRTIRDQADLILQDIANETAQPSGRFAITYPHAMESVLVLPAIEQLSLEFPRLEFHLEANDQTLELIDHQLDVALHVGELSDSSYRALPIGTLHEYFYATPSYTNTHSSIENLSDFADHRLITTHWQGKVFKLTNLKTGAQERLPVVPFAHSETFPGVLSMVRRNMGFALLPDINANPLVRLGELVQVLANYTGPTWPVHLIHAYSSERPQHILRFHQLLKQNFEANLSRP